MLGWLFNLYDACFLWTGVQAYSIFSNIPPLNTPVCGDHVCDIVFNDVTSTSTNNINLHILIIRKKFIVPACMLSKAPDNKEDHSHSISQRKAITSLNKWDDAVILKADKGNATVVMDKSEYHQKCCGLLQAPSYLPLPRDPTPKVESSDLCSHRPK